MRLGMIASTPLAWEALRTSKRVGMRVLVVNCGSSSIKAAVLDSESGERQADISVERLGTSACIALDGSTEIALPGYDHGRALAELLPRLAAAEPTAVGHRVVHGGERFSAPAEIDNELEENRRRGTR